MSKHTPGPWAYSTSQEGWSYTINIFQADNAAPTDGWSDVGYIIKTCKGEEHAIQEANARLIAAAPELLEAAKLVIAWYEAEDDHSKADFYERMKMCRESEDALRAAITKATGDDL